MLSIFRSWRPVYAFRFRVLVRSRVGPIQNALPLTHSAFVTKLVVALARDAALLSFLTSSHLWSALSTSTRRVSTRCDF